MRTQKQIEASRRNGALSRGPKSPEGQRRAKLGRQVAGELARTVLVPGESPTQFQALEQMLCADLKPQTPLEHLLVGRIAAAHWRQLRVWKNEREAAANMPNARVAGNEAEMRLDRQFYRSLDRFVRLRQTLKSTPAAE